MEQDPRYLRNQSRLLHQSYRRNRWLVNVTTALWTMVFAALLLACLLDLAFEFGWGFSAQNAWEFLAGIGFGAFVWVFWMIILKILLNYVRHTYGPEPRDEKLEG